MARGSTACSAHMLAEHPMPAADGWTAIGDPAARLRHGLGELHAYWAGTEQMNAHVVRDAEVNPLVDEVLTRSAGPPLSAIRSVLLDAWPAKRQTPELEAALDLALSFRTWQSLIRDRRLSSAAAADLVTRMVCGSQP